MESSKNRLEGCSKYAWLKGEMSCSIVGILQGLSEGSFRYASYIDLYYQQLVVQVRRGTQVPENCSSYRRGRVCAFLFSM